MRKWVTMACLPLAAMAVIAVHGAAAGENTLQFAEDAVVTRDLAGTSPTRVCRTNARWIRIGFQSLTLKGGDSLELIGSQGEHFTFSGDKWRGRSFYTRALRGSCVTVTPSFSDPDSSYKLSGYQSALTSLGAIESVVTAAGDICATNPTNCAKTSDVVVAINPNVALTLGDNAYDQGTLSDFMTRYEPNWGRFKGITQPALGNHEYQVSTTAQGYFDYFNGVGVDTGPAGKRGEGWYSFDLGEWHFIALNSKNGNTVSATQLAWLDADLRANTKRCTAAYVHHPFISRGNYNGYATMKPFMDRLYASRVDLFLVSHDHNYQRWTPMDGNQVPQNDGVREVVVGTGGGTQYPLRTHSLLQAGKSGTYGVLKVALGATDYEGTFMPIAGSTWTDSFAGTCHRATATIGDYLLTASPTISIPRGSSGGKIVTIMSYGDFASPVDIDVQGLPTGVTVTLSADPVTPPPDGNGTTRLNLRVSSSATVGTYGITVTGTHGAFTRAVKFNLSVK